MMKLNNKRYLRIFTIILLCLALSTTSTQETNSNESDKIYSNIDQKDSSEAASIVTKQITKSLENRLSGLFEKAHSKECRQKIANHFFLFTEALGTESSLPFGDIEIKSECTEEKYDFDNLPDGIGIGEIQDRRYQPSDAIYIKSEKLTVCYGILTHNSPEATIQLIEALYIPDQTVFVIHVDGKESSDETYEALEKYSLSHTYVHILPDSWRIRVNWGGFSMVQATLQMLKYAFAIDRPMNAPLSFHKFIHLASTTYPIASNQQILDRIASYPLNANLMDVVFKPINPSQGSWHYFVECDDTVHRIYRLPPYVGKDIDLYTASQWFIISRDFAKYLAMTPRGSFVREFLDYAQHVVVADETFFGTVLRHSKFCYYHHNDNFLHVQFDRWENELDGNRDERKCLMPNPDHCGRSPTTMTKDYLPMLNLSNDLFARKFLDNVDSEVKDIIDTLRNQSTENKESFDHSFEGHGVLIVAKDTLYDDEPLCMGLGESKNKARLVPCFHSDVPETLAPEWEKGAVILSETLLHNRWELGPCSQNDGSFERLENGLMNVIPGPLYSKNGPACQITQYDGIRQGRCLDAESDQVQPGGEIQVFPCRKRWHQTFYFGNSENYTKQGVIHTNIPKHVQDRIKESNNGFVQEPHMCIGVYGRGTMDETEGEWSLDENENEEEEQETNPSDEDGDEYGNLEELEPLSEFIGDQLVTTKCSNVGAVIEWVLIPFIEEEDANYLLYKEEEDEEEENIEVADTEL